MKTLLQFLVCMAVLTHACAFDTYNPSNNQLSIPSVNVGGLNYNNVVVTLSNVISVGTSGQASQSAEGFWVGSTSNGYSLSTLVLENNEFWSFIGMQSSGVYSVLAFDRGAFSMSGVSGINFFKEYYADYTSLLGYGTGSLIENTAINGMSYVGTSPAVKTMLTPINNSSYLYSKNTDLTDVSGNWVASSLAGLPTNISITPLGVLAGSAANCIFSGTLKSRPSGKNVFDVTINNGVSCRASGLKQTGVAISYMNTNGKNQIVIAVVDEAQKMGELFLVQR